MSGRQHTYSTVVRWTGNLGTGTSTYRAYARDYEIGAERKPTIAGSSDPAFRGDPHRWNPEELLLAALASCHQLWYLHLCADAGVVVVAYEDRAEGFMEETAAGSGQFTRVVLHPHVTISANSHADLAHALHAKANVMCFIANSVRFPVEHSPTVTISPDTSR